MSPSHPQSSTAGTAGAVRTASGTKIIKRRTGGWAKGQLLITNDHMSSGAPELFSTVDEKVIAKGNADRPKGTGRGGGRWGGGGRGGGGGGATVMSAAAQLNPTSSAPNGNGAQGHPMRGHGDLPSTSLPSGVVFRDAERDSKGGRTSAGAGVGTGSVSAEGSVGAEAREGREGVQHPAVDEERAEADPEDEKCLVCGGGGDLLLCDFPECPRVYHQVSHIY